MSRDFKNYRKNLPLEQPLIQEIINQEIVEQQNRIKALQHPRQILEQKRTLLVVAR